MWTASEDVSFDDFTPQLRENILVRHYDNEAVAWSPVGLAPVHLDPLAALVVQIIDGHASIADLLTDIHEVVGVPIEIARNQLHRVLVTANNAGLLTTSPDLELPAEFNLFSGPPNP